MKSLTIILLISQVLHASPCTYAWKKTFLSETDPLNRIEQTTAVYEELWKTLGSEVSAETISALSKSDPFLLPEEAQSKSATFQNALYELKDLTKELGLPEEEVKSRLSQTLLRIAKSRDGTVKRQEKADVEANKSPLIQWPSNLHKVRWNKDGTVGAGISNDQLKVTLQTPDGKRIQHKFTEPVRDVAITRDGKMLVLQQREIQVWKVLDTKTGKLIKEAKPTKKVKTKGDAAADYPEADLELLEDDRTVILHHINGRQVYENNFKKTGRVRYFTNPEYLFKNGEINYIFHKTSFKESSFVFHDYKLDEDHKKAIFYMDIPEIPESFHKSSAHFAAVPTAQKNVYRIVMDALGHAKSKKTHVPVLLEFNMKKRTGRVIPVKGATIASTTADRFLPPNVLADGRVIFSRNTEKDKKFEKQQFYVLDPQTAIVKKFDLFDAVAKTDLGERFLAEVSEQGAFVEVSPGSNQIVLKNEKNTRQLPFDLTPYLPTTP